MLDEHTIEPPAARRKLAAVLSADVAGYSRLMADDEAATVATITEYRGVMGDLVTRHGGRVVDSPGDAVLAEFPSPVEAVAAAADIQHELGRRNGALPEARRMAFRIGINLGDVIEQDGALYGDAVNVAARLEALSEAGGICISGTVFDHVDGKLHIPFAYLGEQQVKNIAKPVRVYRANVATSAEVRTEPRRTPRRSGKPAIAVLPFVNMGSDAEQAYFADGITEDIITELSRFQELHVVARNSVFTYKGRPVKVQDVGRELGVGYVLEGSVRKAGSRIRITAQLVETETGHHLWADRFDESVEDLFSVQDEVTARIVATLAGRVEASERQRVRSLDRTENMQAYDLLLRGREMWFRGNPECNREARRLYEKAIEIDPEYARAYGSLAWTYLLEALRRWTDDSEAAIAKGLEFARKGVEINPASHSNYLALGQILLWQGHHESAVDAFERGVELNPNDGDGYFFLAYAMCLMGDAERAAALVHKGLGLNRNPGRWMRALQVMVPFVARRYEEAVAMMNRVQNPHWMAYYWAAAACGYLGRRAEAEAMVAEIQRLDPGISLAEHLKTVQFKDPRDQEHLAEGLRKAGLA